MTNSQMSSTDRSIFHVDKIDDETAKSQVTIIVIYNIIASLQNMT